MKRLIPIFIGLLFVVIIVEILLLSPSDLDIGQNQNEAIEFMENSEQIDQVVRGMHLMEASEKQKEWELWSDTAISLKTKNSWQLKKVKVLFFSDKGSFTVTGKEGEIHSVTKNLEVTGDVLVRSENGYQFRTEKVIYISEVKKLVSPGQVHMIGPPDHRGFRLKLVGDSLESYVKTAVISIFGNVKTKKKVKKNQVINIKSERANFSGASYFAQFLKNVIMDMNDLRVSGQRARFNYSKNKNLVETILVKGNIRVSDKDKWATADTVLAFLEEDKLVFRGSPRLVQDSDELRGSEIIFLDGGNKVQVKGANMKLKDTDR
jgi:LPS export ABC transporter protein LptC/lipopolysaccharide transport protein LptA